MPLKGRSSKDDNRTGKFSLPGSYDKKQEENEIISHPDHTIRGSMSFFLR